MKRQTYMAVAIMAGAAVTGCGDSADPMPQQADRFTVAVQTTVATSSDTALPQSIEAIMAVDADQAMPIAVY